MALAPLGGVGVIVKTRRKARIGAEEREWGSRRRCHFLNSGVAHFGDGVGTDTYVGVGVDSCVSVGVDSCVGVVEVIVDSRLGVGAFSSKPSAAPPKCLLPIGVTASDLSSALPTAEGIEVSDVGVDVDDDADEDDDDNDDDSMALEAAWTSS